MKKDPFAYNKKKILTILHAIHDKGVMSVPLRSAIQELIMTIKNDDLQKAYEISTVKSYISRKTKIQAKREHEHFFEDDEANEKILGDTIYGILDGIHFVIARKIRQIPSGMTVISTTGVAHGGRVRGLTRIGKLIKKEHRQIVARSRHRTMLEKTVKKK